MQSAGSRLGFCFYRIQFCCSSNGLGCRKGLIVYKIPPGPLACCPLALARLEFNFSQESFVTLQALNAATRTLVHSLVTVRRAFLLQVLADALSGWQACEKGRQHSGICLSSTYEEACVRCEAGSTPSASCRLAWRPNERYFGFLNGTLALQCAVKCSRGATSV